MVARCQLAAGHPEPHALLWLSQGDFRMLRTWTAPNDIMDVATDFPAPLASWPWAGGHVPPVAYSD
jgi:hypothetical protein